VFVPNSSKSLCKRCILNTFNSKMSFSAQSLSLRTSAKSHTDMVVVHLANEQGENLVGLVYFLRPPVCPIGVGPSPTISCPIEYSLSRVSVTLHVCCRMACSHFTQYIGTSQVEVTLECRHIGIAWACMVVQLLLSLSTYLFVYVFSPNY
jgi:hypothetical protein